MSCVLDEQKAEWLLLIIDLNGSQQNEQFVQQLHIYMWVTFIINDKWSGVSFINLREEKGLCHLRLFRESPPQQKVPSTNLQYLFLREDFNSSETCCPKAEIRNTLCKGNTAAAYIYRHGKKGHFSSLTIWNRMKREKTYLEFVNHQ